MSTFSPTADTQNNFRTFYIISQGKKPYVVSLISISWVPPPPPPHTTRFIVELSCQEDIFLGVV